MKHASTRHPVFGVGRTVLFGTIVVTLFFGSLEAGLRAWVYLLREPAERFDVATGTFVLVPGSHPRTAAPPIQVNSRGFVGLEFEDPPKAGTTRIVALGDSCTFGAGTERETYPGQLALRLNHGQSPHRYEVINAGIEGLNSELALRRLLSKVLPLRPDIVVVYLGWNDLMKFDPAGQVENPGVRIAARVIDQLWLIKGMRKLLFYYVRPHLIAPATGPTSRQGAFRDYRPAVFEENLRTIIRVARRGGAATVILMTLPSVVIDDMTAQDLLQANVVFPYYSSAYRVGDFVDLIAAYNRSIRATAASEGARLVDLAGEIDRRLDRRTLFLDTMHPNQRGRELIADILADHLRINGLTGEYGDAGLGSPVDNVLEHRRLKELRQPNQRLGIRPPLAVDPAEGAID